MNRKAAFEGDNPVVIVGRRTGDIIMGVCAFLLLALFIFAGVDAARNLQTQWGTALMAVGGWIFFGWILIGVAWRLRDRLPALVADETGLRLHPSLSPRPLPWGEVRSIAFKPARSNREPDVLRIKLNTTVRSLSHPWGSDNLRLASPYLGLSRQEAADLLRQLRRLRGLKVVTPRGRRQVS
ncbi:MAG TPA: hypothetical protein VNZ85_09255 [Caulobacter sp.]|nr:hypothetical protein [Caulobacter sp.]